MSKLNVNVGDDFPLDGDVAVKQCAHRGDFRGEMWRDWKREQHEMRMRWRQEWREKFHAFRERLRTQKEEKNA